MNFVRSLHLRRWSDEGDARSRLPQLLRRLIYASCAPKRVEFSTQEEVQRPGWDGLAEVDCGNSFVPSGVSLWEISTESRIVAKAESDLAKRSNDPQGFAKGEVTVVMVTARAWPTKPSKRAWEKQQCALGGWREVRVLDASDLEAWLEATPSVDWWLAYLLKLRPVGACDFERHWQALASLSKPALQPSVFLASRGRVVERINAWMRAEASSLTIEAVTCGEAIDFVAALLAQNQATEARALLVESREAWRALAGPGTPLLLVTHPKLELETEQIAAAVAQGHHVFVPIQTSASRGGEVFSLPLVRRHHLHEALLACGFGFEVAARHAREAGGHLGVLKRRLAAAVGVLPAWATPAMAVELAPLVLAGGWDESRPADQEALVQLTGREFNEIAALARKWAQSEDAPLIQRGGEWRFTSREESWCLLARHLTSGQLNKFSEVAGSVLGEMDPRYEVAMSERPYANLRGQVTHRSRRLREGVAESLVLLALFGEELNGPASVRDIVGQLLQGAGWQRWASLEGELPLLAEAAPEAFLTAAESDLALPESALVRLFLEEDKSPWCASSPHTGMLWAFEVLCWSPDFLSRASLILARLTRLEPGGKLGNRPARSLGDTFLPWAPHTGATPEQQLAVLSYLLVLEHSTVWRLLFAYLPSNHGCTNPRSYPRWSEWADYEWHEVPQEQYVKQVLAIADLILAHADWTPTCWAVLIEKLERFPDQHADRIVERLQVLNPSNFLLEDRLKLWNQLRTKVARHKRCEEKNWALRREMTALLAKVSARFEPEDPLEFYAWLFKSGVLMEFYESADHYDTSREALEKAQIGALRKIHAVHGLAGIKVLAERANETSAMGFHVAAQGICVDDAHILPDSFNGTEAWRTFALGYVAGRFKLEGWSWLDELQVNLWCPDHAGWLSRVLPVEAITWKWFDCLGPDFRHAYWHRVCPWPKKMKDHDLEVAVSSLLEHGRALAAIDLIHSAKFLKLATPHSLVAQTLESFLVTKEEPPASDAAGHIAWQVCELIDHLTVHPELPTQRLAQLEWALMGILSAQQHVPRTLFKWLAEDPKFFAQVVRIAFPGRERSENVDPHRAQHAREMLQAWRHLPGKEPDDSVNSTTLLQWCAEVRAECSSGGYPDLGDSMIGKTLANSPSEADGSWPCIPVRACIEHFASEALDRGFHIGTFNLRGITTRGPGDGGDQERSLAARFRGYRDACKFRWPRTARQLSDLADFYEKDARRYDQRALDE